MSEVPTVVSESTAIEIIRKEGSARSWKAIGSISGGLLLYYANASGVSPAVGLSGNQFTVVGVSLFSQTSGGRIVTIKGKVRCYWDGATAPTLGTPVGASTAFSGMFEASSGSALPVGIFVGTGAGSSLAAANSGTLQVIEI